MLLSTVAASLITTGAVAQTRYAAHDERPIATPAPYPANIVDDTRRPGFNGRLWVDRTIVGGAPREWPLDLGGPGPAFYGAPDSQRADVFVRRDAQVIAINGWNSIEPETLYPLENARQFWLKEQGYTGGVRTFINPAVLRGVTPREVVIEPRAKFRTPADAPRIQRRMHVSLPAHDVSEVRIFLPDTAPIAMRTRVMPQASVASSAR
ncbi:MAG: hypothetical protein AAF297_02450 [Planctomycetota bacterium]